MRIDWRLTKTYVKECDLLTQMDLAQLNHTRADGEDWLISAEDLARMLGANALLLVGDGERFRVIPK